jgi:integrase
MNASQLGGNAPPSTRTLRDLFENEYRPLRLVGRSVRTLQLFRYTIKAFGLYLGREPTLGDLQDIVLSNYLQHMIDGKRARASVNKERRQLLALWNFAARRRYVTQFPEVRPVPEPERIPKAWSVEDLQKIAIACGMVGEFIRPDYGGIPTGLWWTALHAVLWDSGERITAILRLKWTDLAGEWLTIHAEYRKGSSRSMQVKLRPESVQMLHAMRRGHEEIFFWPYRQGNYVYVIYKKILKAAGVEHDRYSKFHRMRRSVASHLTAAGANATAALGHANAATTARYIDPRIAKPVQVSEVLPSFLSEQES